MNNNTIQKKVIIDTQLIYYITGLSEYKIDKNSLFSKLDEFSNNNLFISELSLVEMINKLNFTDFKKILLFLIDKKFKVVTFFKEPLLPLSRDFLNNINNSFFEKLYNKSIEYKILLESEMIHLYLNLILVLFYKILYEEVDSMNQQIIYDNIQDIILNYKEDLFNEIRSFVLKSYNDNNITAKESTENIKKLLLLPILMLTNKLLKREPINILNFDKNDLKKLDSDLKSGKLFEKVYDKYISTEDKKIVTGKYIQYLRKFKSSFIKTMKEPIDHFFKNKDIENFEEYPELVLNIYYDVLYNFLCTTEKIKKNDIIDVQFLFYSKEDYDFITFDNSLISKIENNSAGYKNKIKSIIKP